MSQAWMKFYPSDWRSDPAVRMCSLAARGLWTEMLCLMHEAVPYGSLVVNGRQLEPHQVAALAGRQTSEVDRLLKELELAGVFSRDEDGTIFSRRMRRDIAKAARDRDNGKGGGNPNLKKTVNDRVNPPLKAQKPEARPEAIASGERAPASAARSTALPSNALPSEADRAAAADGGLSEMEFRSEWGVFRDYQVSHSRRSFDWSASWRTWIHRSKRFNSKDKSDGSDRSAAAAAKRLQASLASLGDPPPAMLPDSGGRG